MNLHEKDSADVQFTLKILSLNRTNLQTHSFPLISLGFYLIHRSV